jgi:hypothetical protein
MEYDTEVGGGVFSYFVDQARVERPRRRFALFPERPGVGGPQVTSFALNDAAFSEVCDLALR